jgi:serine/threonine protein kinase
MSDALLQSEAVEFHLSYDMWQLGLLLYEVAQGEPYWPASMQDARILHTLATPTERLPHESRPLRTPEAHQMLTDLMKRDPAERMNAADFWKRLEHFNTREHTLNPVVDIPVTKDVSLDS